MTTDENLHQRLEADAADLLRLITHIAPRTGATPMEIARLDQLAARANRISREIDPVTRATGRAVPTAECRHQGRPAGDA